MSQALVVEDRREAWRRAGERICAGAPPTPGVYVLRDETGRALYVGKAVNLRRRLRAHFAERRWRGLKAALGARRGRGVAGGRLGARGAAARGRADSASCEPVVNVQIGPPDAIDARRCRARSLRDVIVVAPVGRAGFGGAGRGARRRRLADSADATERRRPGGALPRG